MRVVAATCFMFLGIILVDPQGLKNQLLSVTVHILKNIQSLLLPIAREIQLLVCPVGPACSVPAPFQCVGENI
jgi:hypothetical protein